MEKDTGVHGEQIKGPNRGQMGRGWEHQGSLDKQSSELEEPEPLWLKQGAKFCHMSPVLQSRQATDFGLWLLAEWNTVLSSEEKQLLQHIC